MRALVLIWDNAAWPISREVRPWLKHRNRRVKAEGGCRLLPPAAACCRLLPPAAACCRLLVGRLPGKSPWLNPIEPGWVHGKRAVAEPAHKLPAAELKQRLCAHYRCPLLPPLAQQVA